MTSRISISLLFYIILFFSRTQCTKHRRILKKDVRSYFHLSGFNFWPGGKLEVKVNHLTFDYRFNSKLGLTLTKTVNEVITPYMEGGQNQCFLADYPLTADIPIISFLFDLSNNQLLVNCSNLFPFLDIKFVTESNLVVNDVQKSIPQSPEVGVMIRQKRSAYIESGRGGKDTKSYDNSKRVIETASPQNESPNAATGSETCNSFKVPFKSEIIGHQRKISDLQFLVSMRGIEAGGFYILYFHNCPETHQLPLPVDGSINIVECNGDNYLSAESMPLPNLYFFMSFIFFVTGCMWIAVLCKKGKKPFKFHYLMGLVVFLHSLSLLFHGINYHIIAKEGYPMEALTVLECIILFLKEALFFITIMLVSTRYAFINHIKKISMILVLLKFLTFVGYIIMKESEEGEPQYYTWRKILVLDDLIFCGVILFLFVCSIRHLREASRKVGKAAVDLNKLKLLKHFFIMIICYVYISRIIVVLLKMTLTFEYQWLDHVFGGAATFTFFIVTGINFQPTTSSSYFQLSQLDDVEINEVITQTELTENVSKTVQSQESGGKK